MRASHVALLSLAASTAAPIFAAPLSYARWKDGGTALSARGSSDGSTEVKSANSNYVPESRSDIDERLTTRDAVDDLMTAITNMKTRAPEVEQGAHARDPSDNLFDVVERSVPNDATSGSVHSPVYTIDDLSSLLSGRGLSSAEDIQARSIFSDAFKVGFSLLSQILRRDVTPELLAARDGPEDLTSDKFVKVLNDALASSRRDVASDGLAARGDWEDFVKILNTRDDTVEDILDKYINSREPSPQQETQARDIGPTKTAAWDESSTTALINTLLNSRDPSKGELTTGEVLSIASLGSRALDELD